MVMRFAFPLSILSQCAIIHNCNVLCLNVDSFCVAVTYSPCLEILWSHNSVTQTNSDRLTLSKEDGGFYHCDITKARPEDDVSVELQYKHYPDQKYSVVQVQVHL